VGRGCAFVGCHCVATYSVDGLQATWYPLAGRACRCGTLRRLPCCTPLRAVRPAWYVRKYMFVYMCVCLYVGSKVTASSGYRCVLVCMWECANAYACACACTCACVYVLFIAPHPTKIHFLVPLHLCA
jgi:hypothetical protein